MSTLGVRYPGLRDLIAPDAPLCVLPAAWGSRKGRCGAVPIFSSAFTARTSVYRLQTQTRGALLT